jgi:hypothetical protein
VPDDPIFKLVFPQPEMLSTHQRGVMLDILLDRGSTRVKLREAAEQIRATLNAHPARQKEDNVPVMDGELLSGLQHKYRETVLFFPMEVRTYARRALDLSVDEQSGSILPLVLHILLPLGPVYLSRLITAVQVQRYTDTTYVHFAPSSSE